MNLQRNLGSALQYFFVGLAAFVSIFPFIWMMVGATNISVDIMAGKFAIGSALVENITKFFTLVDVPLVFWNSIKVAGLGTIFTIAISSLAGYGFEMFRSKWRDRVYSFVLLTLMVPFAALMIPLFMMMARSGSSTPTPRSSCRPSRLPSSSSISASRQKPRLNCATPPRSTASRNGRSSSYIYVPVMRSTYAAALVIVFMTNWNNYLWPLIVLQSNDTKTITLVVSSLASSRIIPISAW